MDSKNLVEMIWSGEGDILFIFLPYFERKEIIWFLNSRDLCTWKLKYSFVDNYGVG